MNCMERAFREPMTKKMKIAMNMVWDAGGAAKREELLEKLPLAEGAHIESRRSAAYLTNFLVSRGIFRYRNRFFHKKRDWVVETRFSRNEYEAFEEQQKGRGF